MEQDSFIPIIELRIKALGKEMVSCFASQTEHMLPFIEKAVEKYCSQENLQSTVDKLVYECVNSAISEALNSYEVKSELKKIIIQDLFKD